MQIFLDGGKLEDRQWLIACPHVYFSLTVCRRQTGCLGVHTANNNHCVHAQSMPSCMQVDEAHGDARLGPEGAAGGPEYVALSDAEVSTAFYFCNSFGAVNPYGIAAQHRSAAFQLAMWEAHQSVRQLQPITHASPIQNPHLTLPLHSHPPAHNSAPSHPIHPHHLRLQVLQQLHPQRTWHRAQEFARKVVGEIRHQLRDAELLTLPPGRRWEQLSHAVLLHGSLLPAAAAGVASPRGPAGGVEAKCVGGLGE